MEKKEKRVEQTILITDDSEMNRSLLADMLGNDYNILEAEDGTQALAYLQNEGSKIDLVLLDIVMPKMDGFEVLAYMNRNGWIKDIPVIVISSETSPSCMERAYELGVTDFINRPFDVWIVRRRVMNTLMLAGKQKMLVGMVTDQIYKREKMSNLMITILSHIVEFRNGESGMHVLHIRTISEILLKNIVIKTNKYGLTQMDISLISTASALHDIGKIGIPDEILNKPGRFTDEEYAIMKKHSELGAAMLDDLDFLQDEKLVKYAREICRWHHERYDGRGYPDGLKGDEIPISAQIVALADVYDALTSPRVYKPAFPHEKAIQMIVNGECGVFNPLLIECLLEVEETLAKELKVNSFSRDTYDKMQYISDEIMQDEELSTSARTLTLLENERIKTRFFAELSQEIQFEYVMDSSLLMIYDFGKKK
ncbi:MAG: response regulator, partial [Anaeroplasmataceae bacterium]|nr:response regulator [Anaeroplasmataceae bacterium]